MKYFLQKRLFAAVTAMLIVFSSVAANAEQTELFAEDDYSEIITELDFSSFSESDLNFVGTRPQTNAYIIGNDGFKFLKTASKTRVSIIEDESCKGGKALKVSERGELAAEFAEGAGYKSGKIKIEGRIKVNSGTVNIKIGNESNSASIITATNNSAKLYKQTSQGKNATAENAQAPEGGYTTFSYEMDLTNTAVTQYMLNGEASSLSEGLLPHYDGTVDILKSGISLVEFEQSTSNGEYIIDYLNYSLYTIAPDVKSVSFTTVDGTKVEYDEETKITTAIESVDILFDSVMNESSLSAITLLDSDENIQEYKGVYDKSTGTYRLVLPSCLAQNSEYTLVVPKSVKAADKSTLKAEKRVTFETSEGEYRVLSFYAENASGNRIGILGEAGGKIVLKAVVLNTAELPGKASIVYNEVKDKLMTKMLYKNFEISSADRKPVLSWEITPGDGVGEIRGFLWNDLKEHIPLYNFVNLK